MMESLDSTNMSMSKVLETANSREASKAAVHGVAELDMSEQLKNTNNSVSHIFIRRRFFNLKYRILYIPIGKLDASL